MHWGKHCKIGEKMHQWVFIHMFSYPGLTHCRTRHHWRRRRWRRRLHKDWRGRWRWRRHCCRWKNDGRKFLSREAIIFKFAQFSIFTQICAKKKKIPYISDTCTHAGAHNGMHCAAHGGPISGIYVCDNYCNYKNSLLYQKSGQK